MHICIFCAIFCIDFLENYLLGSFLGWVSLILGHFLIYWILKRYFKEEVILKMQVGVREKRIGYFIMILHFVLLFGAFIFMAFWNQSHP